MANHMQTTSSDLRAREKQAVEGEVTRPGPVFRPDVDILERADAFVVVADLPGVDANSVDVKLEKGVLPPGVPHLGGHRRERCLGVDEKRCAGAAPAEERAAQASNDLGAYRLARRPARPENPHSPAAFSSSPRPGTWFISRRIPSGSSKSTE